MERDFVAHLIARFEASEVRYLIAGGLAVIAHGYTRLTFDLDFVIDLAPENALKAIEILQDEGYSPKIPVPFEQFADENLRRDWVENRNMLAFPLYSEKHRATGIDIFVREPFDFEEAYERQFRKEIGPGVTARFVSLGDLLDLKHEAGRPKDIQDIYYLQAIKDKNESTNSPSEN